MGLLCSMVTAASEVLFSLTYMEMREGFIRRGH